MTAAHSIAMAPISRGRVSQFSRHIGNARIQPSVSSGSKARDRILNRSAKTDFKIFIQKSSAGSRPPETSRFSSSITLSKSLSGIVSKSKYLLFRIGQPSHSERTTFGTVRQNYVQHAARARGFVGCVSHWKRLFKAPSANVSKARANLVDDCQSVGGNCSATFPESHLWGFLVPSQNILLLTSVFRLAEGNAPPLVKPHAQRQCVLSDVITSKQVRQI